MVPHLHATTSERWHLMASGGTALRDTEDSSGSAQALDGCTCCTTSPRSTRRAEKVPSAASTAVTAARERTPWCLRTTASPTAAGAGRGRSQGSRARLIPRRTSCWPLDRKWKQDGLEAWTTSPSTGEQDGDGVKRGDIAILFLIAFVFLILKNCILFLRTFPPSVRCVAIKISGTLFQVHLHSTSNMKKIKCWCTWALIVQKISKENTI